MAPTAAADRATDLEARVGLLTAEVVELRSQVDGLGSSLDALRRSLGE